MSQAPSRLFVPSRRTRRFALPLILATVLVLAVYAGFFYELSAQALRWLRTTKLVRSKDLVQCHENLISESPVWGTGN